MSHSSRSQELYYTHNKSVEDAQKGFEHLAQLRSTVQGSGSQGPKRTKFTPDETETIQLYFRDNLASRTVPSAEECKVFLENHPMQRTHKQVRDKV